MKNQILLNNGRQVVHRGVEGHAGDGGGICYGLECSYLRLFLEGYVYLGQRHQAPPRELGGNGGHRGDQGIGGEVELEE